MTPYRICRGIWQVLPIEDQTLITDTLQRLVDHELESIAVDVCRRVFAKEVDTARTLDADGQRLSPFVTLTLDELRRIVAAPGWTLAMRRARAEEALAAFGF
jgi:hypothetical protein